MTSETLGTTLMVAMTVTMVAVGILSFVLHNPISDGESRVNGGSGTSGASITEIETTPQAPETSPTTPVTGPEPDAPPAPEPEPKPPEDGSGCAWDKGELVYSDPRAGCQKCPTPLNRVQTITLPRPCQAYWEGQKAYQKAEEWRETQGLPPLSVPEV